MLDWCGNVAQSIADIPSLIIDGILDGLAYLFVPDNDVLETEVQRLVDTITLSTGVEIVDYSVIFGSPSDKLDAITGANVYGLTGTLSYVRFDWLVYAVRWFKPYIRGFVVVLLTLYNINQLLAFLDIGVISFGSVSSRTETDIVKK